MTQRHQDPPHEGSSEALLDWLFENGFIALERAPGILRRAPAPVALPADELWDRVEGMMLGLMIGDSLGNRAESLVPGKRQELLGEIRDYLPHHGAGNRRVGLPSDDSQLALWTLESLLEEGRLDPDALARKYCGSRIYGIGGTVRQFKARYQDEGLPWYEAGPASAGNGALMRIAPVLIPHLAEPTARLWSDTVLAATLTHNDRASTGSCVAFVAILWELLGRNEAPTPQWWIERFVTVLRPLEGVATRYASRVAGDAYAGPLWRFLEERLPAAHARQLSAREACDGWYSGAYLLETVPSALYILMRHADDPEEAIVRAVNDTRDNDTVAAIVGAAVGALHGRAAFPTKWIDGLLGRTRDDDDGYAFALLRAARERWLGGPVSIADRYGLTRFVQAQHDVYARALTEIRAGAKRTHWMWFIFPQLAGLGHSAMAREYAISGASEARAYLEHPTLGTRLVECAKATLAVEGRSAGEIFGAPDDMKLRSSATLFAAVSAEGSVFHRLIEKYFEGMRDERTVELLKTEAGPSPGTPDPSSAAMRPRSG